jgi:hypothetical protein
LQPCSDEEESALWNALRAKILGGDHSKEDF